MGREWCFPEITEGTIIDVRRELGIDWHLVFDQDTKEIAKAFSAVGIANLIWFLLSAECEKQSVTHEDFASGLNHAARKAATEALVDAFFTLDHGPEAGREIAKSLMERVQMESKKAVAALKKQSGGSPGSPA